MNRIHLFVVGVFTSFGNTGFAQESAAPTVLQPVIEIELFAGGGSSFAPVLTQELWEKYTPDFSEPSSTDGFTRNSSVGFASPSFLFSFRKSYRNSYLEASKVRSSFGIILGKGTGIYSEQRWSKTTSVTIDSFTVASSGQTFAIDSASTELISRNFRAQDFVIGISQRFETNPARRFSFHYGVDLLLGFSANGYMQQSHTQYAFYTPSLGSNTTQNEMYAVEYSESPGPKYRSLNAQFPLELAFKPFLRKSGWDMLTLGFSARPSLQWYYLDNQKGTLFTPWYGMVLRVAI